MARTVEEVVDLDQTVKLRKEMHEVVTEDGAPLILIRKRPLRQPKGTPILMIHGLGQNRYSWDLSRRSLANYLVANGYDVFIAELRGHGLSRANGTHYPQRFEDYVDYDCPALIKAVREITGHDKIFLMGHSLGGTISYCISPAQQQHLRGMIPITAPSHFGRGFKLVTFLARTLGQLQRFRRIGRLAPRPIMVDWIGLLTTYAIDLIDHPRNVLADFFWYPRSIRRDILLERVSRGYDRTGAAVIGIMIKWARTGRFLSSQDERDYESMLADVKVPALFVSADRDTVVPRESIEIGFDCLGSKDKTWREFGVEKDGIHFGHCDVICGDAAPTMVWPYLLGWIRSHESSRAERDERAYA
jgi:pimeloyl-ACP methyl ester carboxylesterase